MVVCSKCGHQNIDNSTVIGDASTSFPKPGAESKLPIPDTQLIIGVVTTLLPGSCSGFINDEIYFRASLVQSQEPLNVGDKVVVEASRTPENGKGTPFKYKALKISKVDLDLTESTTIKTRRTKRTANSFLDCDDDDADSQNVFEFLSPFRRNPHAQQKPQTYIPTPQSAQLKCSKCHDSNHEAEACTLTTHEARILVHQRILANKGPDGLARYKREQKWIAKRKKRDNQARNEWEFRTEQFKFTTGNQNHAKSKPVEVRQTFVATKLETPSISKPVNENKTAKLRENPKLNLDDHVQEDNRNLLEFDLSKVKQEVIDDLNAFNIHDDNAEVDDTKELQNYGNEPEKEETLKCKNCSAKTHETINCVSATRELHHMQRKLAEQQILNDDGPEALRIYKNGRNRAWKSYSKNITRRIEQFEEKIQRYGPPPVSPSLPEQAEDEKEEGEVCEHLYFRNAEGQDPVLKRCLQCLDFSHKVNFCPYRFKERQTVEILEAIKSRREKFRASHGQDMFDLYMDNLTFYCQQQVERNGKAKRKLEDMSRTQWPYQENAKRFKNSNQISTLGAPPSHVIAPTHYQSTEMSDPYQHYNYGLNSYEIPPPQFQYVAPPPGAVSFESSFSNHQDSSWNDNYF